MTTHKPFIPSYHDGVLRILHLGRKSQLNPLHENEAIEASQADTEKHIRARHEGLIEFFPLGERCSGRIVDRKSLHQTLRLLETSQVDLVATEDISRLSRNVRDVHAFAQDCIHAGTRFVAVRDNLDTANSD